MAESIPSLLQDGTCDTPSFEISEETKDEILAAIGYDGSQLTLEQRRFLWDCGWRPEDVVPNYDPDDYAESPLFEGCEEAEKPSEEEILVEQAEALGKQFNYDGSMLTLEQRRALLKKMFALHLKDNGQRSPQYYADKSQCLSVAETAWPGIVGYLKADRLKRGFIEPEELIDRLGKLKPSDNFELRKFRHPRMEWKSPTPLEEEPLEIGPSWPTWLYDQLYAVSDMENQLGRKSAAQHHQQIRKSADQHRQEIKDRWAAVESGVELTPLPDLHLLKNMGHSPGGTLFPWYLVKGLITLREHANEIGGQSYNEEYDSAMAKREKAINRWRERNPDSILADDPISIYKTWPTDLMDELNEIDLEAIRCGRRKYVALLRVAETKMQTLVAFWMDCGLVTGQRTPPSCWWQDPKAKAKRLPKPRNLQERLDVIKTEFGHHSDIGKKVRMIETSCWLESTINGDSEPASDPPLPQSLLDELDIVWRNRDRLDQDDTEDEMIARFRRWRESKYQQCVDEGLRTPPQLGSDTGPEEPVQTASPECFGLINLVRDGTSGSVIAPEETRQLQENPSRARRQLRMNPTAEDRAIWPGRLRPRTKSEVQTSWRDRLRTRPDAVGALRDRTKAANTQTRKPQGIIKRRKVSKKKRPAATKGQATTFTTQKADPSHPGTQSHFNESASQAASGSVTKARGANLRRRSPRQISTAQPQGVQKIRNGNRSSFALTTYRKQGLLRLLTPPRSE